MNYANYLALWEVTFGLLLVSVLFYTGFALCWTLSVSSNHDYVFSKEIRVSQKHMTTTLGYISAPSIDFSLSEPTN